MCGGCSTGFFTKPQHAQLPAMFPSSEVQTTRYLTGPSLGTEQNAPTSLHFPPASGLSPQPDCCLASEGHVSRSIPKVWRR